MKKIKRAIEIKVEGTDSFEAINLEWTDEKLNRGPINEDYYDDEQINVTLAHKNKPTEYK